MTIHYSVGDLIDHERYGKGVVAEVSASSIVVYLQRGGEMQFSRNSDEISILKQANPDAAPTEVKLDVDELEFMIYNVLDKYALNPEVVELGDKWVGGTLELKPADESLKSKELPIDTFFHKIVMLRDRLRVLEQNINSHKSLTDEEKVNLQQYITRCYGSLTTFNVLFKYKSDYFEGQKGEK